MPISSNRFSSDFSLLDIRFLSNAQAQTKPTDVANTRNPILSFGEQASASSSSSSSSSTSSPSLLALPLPLSSSNVESSVIQNTINCTNATNVGCCIGQSQNRAEDLPERVSKLNRTSMNDAPSHAHAVNVNTLRTRDTVYGEYESSTRVVGNDRTNSTATTATLTCCTNTNTNTMTIERTETTTESWREARETQTTATNGSSLVNIESNQTRFSRDRLFHASVSSTAHAFFDLFKFSRNSESNRHNFSRSNRENISRKNSCAIAAMRLNVPNQDSTAVAAREPSISVSTHRVNHIDNSKTVVNISNAHDGLQPLGTMTTTTSSTSCPSASHIFENGTLLGAIVSQAQPSLTIQVNQSDQQSQQTQVISTHCHIHQLNRAETLPFDQFHIVFFFRSFVVFVGFTFVYYGSIADLSALIFISIKYLPLHFFSLLFCNSMSLLIGKWIDGYVKWIGFTMAHFFHLNEQQPQQPNEQTQQVNFVSYRAVPVQVINNSSGSAIKNSIDICKSDKTNNTNSDHNSMQLQTKSHTNLSESSEKCDNIEFIGENTINSNPNGNGNGNANANGNSNANGNGNGIVNVNASVVLSDGVLSGFVNANSSGNSNMISVTENTNNSNPNHTSQIQLNQRTFTSTEAQTDDFEATQQNQSQEQPRQSPMAADSALIEPTVKNSSKPNHSHSRRTGTDTEAQSSREQRRRERRERRQPRNTRQHVHPPNQSMALHSHHSNCEILPDILHNHVISHPPPYTTLPMPTHCQINAASVLTQSPPPSVLVPGPPSALIPVGISDDGRYTFPLPIMRR